jgi:hypothetical protein
MVPEALDDLTPEQRHHVYKMLQLRILVDPDGTLRVSGTFGDKLQLGEYGPTRASGASTSAKPSPTPSCGA